jgi:anti-sigma factor RsiW
VDCKRVDEELVAFQLAAIDGGTRAAVEAHLLGCARCVGAYLMLKRAVDAGEEASAPSQMVRARIRAAATEIAGPRSKRTWMWAAAATATAASVAAAIVLLVQRPAPTPTATVTPRIERQAPVENVVDTARAMPVNLSYL